MFVELYAHAVSSELAEVPNPAPQAPPGVADPVNTILGWGKWSLGVIALIGLGIIIAKLFLGKMGHSNTAAQGVSGLPWWLLAATLTAGSVSIVGFFFD